MSPPRLASYFERDYCAAGAVHLLREREAKYPAMVSAGRLTAEAAARGLALAGAVADQWRWAMDPDGVIDPPWDEALGNHCFGFYGFELEQEMSAAAGRARAIASRDPDHWPKRELADLYEALAWWQGRDPHHGDCRIVRDTSCARRCAATIAARETERKAA